MHEKAKRHRIGAVGFASVCFASTLASQTISGRVTDSAGKPVPHARILAHAWGDTTDAALRMAFSNDRGEYRLQLAARGRFVLTAFNIGYRPQPERAVDITDGDAAADVVMRKLPAMMATVAVSDFGCVPLNSPHQAAQVRDLVRQVQNLIRSRRAIEREYEYQVHESFEFHSRDFTQRPDDTSHLGEIPAHHRITDGPIALRQNLSYWAFPNEGIVISPRFDSAFCLDTTLFRAGSQLEVRFREISGQNSLPGSGTIRTTATGMPTRIQFNAGRDLQGALLYHEVEIEGDAFPFIARVAAGPAGAAQRDFRYSKFVRVRPPGPPPAPASEQVGGEHAEVGLLQREHHPPVAAVTHV